MSQSNTPNSIPYVKPGSVPQCLRHTMPCVPLEEAAWIAEFLGAACEALLTSDDPVNAEACVTPCYWTRSPLHLERCLSRLWICSTRRTTCCGARNRRRPPMLTPEQKEMWRRLDSLTSGLADLLQWNAADGNGVTSEDADRASCYLAIVGEVRRAMFKLCPAEEMYDVNQGGAA